MSKISIEGNASGTGTFTIASPNSNTNRTLNLPDSSGTVVLTQAAGGVVTNTAVGTSALAANTTGADNTAVGFNALALNTTGGDNTAVGNAALDANTTGIQNTAVGDNSLGSNTSGSFNTALGRGALSSNTTANNNTAVGFSALDANTTGANNTAVGYGALDANTTGKESVAVGMEALTAATTGVSNTAVGFRSMQALTTGSENACFGFNSGGSMTTGSNNTIIGFGSGDSITTGSKNTIIGRYSGSAAPISATGSNFVVLSDGDGNIVATLKSAGGIFEAVSTAGAGTNTMKYNTNNGRITYDTSSERYKDNIRDSGYGLSHVMQMRSTMFEYKDSGRTDVGLIAEELDLIIPELVTKNAEGQPDAVSYDRMVSVLVKAIQELSAQVTALQAEVESLKNPT